MGNNKGIATTAIWCEIPFCLYVDDGLYELECDNKPGAINFKRRSRYSTVENLPFNKGGVIINADPLNCEIKGDRYGRVAYSEVVVYIPSLESVLEADPILEKAIKYVNRFIEVYRIATEEFWIQPISIADLVVTQFRHCDENGNEVPGLVYGSPLAIPGLSIGGPVPIIASGIDAIKRPPTIHATIKDMLKQNISIPTYTTLMLDAQNSIRFGRFPSAVIQTQTAFENFFYTYVRQQLSSAKSISPSLLQAELDEGNLKREMNKKLTGRVKVDKLAYFSELVTNPQRSFTSGVVEHDNWFSQTYQLRNDVIHKGKNDVTQKQAEDAYKAVEKSFNFFGQDWRNITFR